MLWVFVNGGLTWRKQSLGEEQNIRDHYAKEVARLTEKLKSETKSFHEAIESMERHWRDMLDTADERHAECVKERDAIHKEVMALRNEVAGLQAKIREYSTNSLLILSKDMEVEGSHSLEAARRLKKRSKK